MGLSYPVLTPDSQILFAAKLNEIRDFYFDSALRDAVAVVDVAMIDAELHQIASRASLSALARHSLRGEAFYPVPSLLEARPRLLGYYRLLYGISRKRFYQSSAFSRFGAMEDSGILRERVKPELTDLCLSLAATADALVASLDPISRDLIHELQAMTLGALFKGLGEQPGG